MTNRFEPLPAISANRRESVPPLPAIMLIDLPNWLGDLVMALPATARLVAANRGGRTVLHVRDATARLVSTVFPDVEVVVSPRGENPLRTARRLRRIGLGADVGITLRNAARAKVVLRLVAGWSAGSASQGGRLCLSWAFEPDLGRHQIHDGDAVLERLGLAPADGRWRTTITGPLAVAGETDFEAAGIGGDRPVVGLAPGVAWGGSAKRWPEEYFGRLAALLAKHDFEPVVVIGPGEAATGRAVARAAGFNLPVLAEHLDAAGLAALLQRMACLVGNDSGPTHLASILGVPTVALFGPTDERRTAPMVPEGQVVRCSVECAPCRQAQCPLDHQDCLRGLAPDAVYASVASHVGARKATVPVVVNSVLAEGARRKKPRRRGFGSGVVQG